MNGRAQKSGALPVVWFKRVGLVVFVLGVAAMVAAAGWPIPGDADLNSSGAVSRVPEAAEAAVSSSELARAVAGRRLIRPSQVRAAVKDTGLAARLLERLKLQSVVQMRGEPVAYVKVENAGVTSVRAGGRLLDFEVRQVEPDRVVLVLEGVEALLSH